MLKHSMSVFSILYLEIVEYALLLCLPDLLSFAFTDVVNTNTEGLIRMHLNFRHSNIKN